MKSVCIFLFYLIFKHGILTRVLFSTSFEQKAQAYFGELRERESKKKKKDTFNFLSVL